MDGSNQLVCDAVVAIEATPIKPSATPQKAGGIRRISNLGDAVELAVAAIKVLELEQSLCMFCGSVL